MPRDPREGGQASIIQSQFSEIEQSFVGFLSLLNPMVQFENPLECRRFL